MDILPLSININNFPEDIDNIISSYTFHKPLYYHKKNFNIVLIEFKDFVYNNRCNDCKIFSTNLIKKPACIDFDCCYKLSCKDDCTDILPCCYKKFRVHDQFGFIPKHYCSDCHFYYQPSFYWTSEYRNDREEIGVGYDYTELHTITDDDLIL